MTNITRYKTFVKSTAEENTPFKRILKKTAFALLENLQFPDLTSAKSHLRSFYPKAVFSSVLRCEGKRRISISVQKQFSGVLLMLRGITQMFCYVFLHPVDGKKDQTGIDFVQFFKTGGRGPPGSQTGHTSFAAGGHI